MDKGEPPVEQTPSEPKPEPKQFAQEWNPSEDQAVALTGALSWLKLAAAKEVTIYDPMGGYPIDTEMRLRADPTNPYLTIGGPAGSGKSRLTGQIVKEIEKEHGKLHIAYATYTGKASQVLAASLKAAGVVPDYCGTCHGLLYKPDVDKRTGRILGWSKQSALDYDLIIIDEASMVPEAMFNDLLRFGIPLMMIGDNHQLPPVGEDFSVMMDPHLRLNTIHRQAKDNPIINLSVMARAGKSIRQMCEFANSDPSGRLAWVSGIEGIYEALEFAAPPGFIVSFTNKRRCVTNQLMRRSQKRGETPEVGETLICVKNAYLGTGLLANGTRMTVTGVEAPSDEHTYNLVVDTDNGQGPFPLRVSRYQFGRGSTFKGFDEIPGDHYDWDSVGILADYGYALTCHKSQGSQSASVAVLLERALRVLNPDEHRRWIYTALTRASERLMLVTDV